MASTQSDQLADLFGEAQQRVNVPDLNLSTMRDIFEGLSAAAGKEPEGVRYEEVDANGVPALWAIPEGSDDAVLLFNHAGGTVLCSMNSDRKIGGHLAKAAGIRALVLDYRRSPENKYPAQPDDVETAYRWLLSQGYPPERIVSGGHSIGGNLAVGLALRLRDMGEPLPGAILAISAWLDMEMKSPTLQTNAATDKMLSVELAESIRDLWLGGTDVKYDDPSVNPLRADLTGLPPINIYYGAHEILAGEIVQFADLTKAAGLDSNLHVVDEGQHLFLLGVGRVPETDAAVTEIGQWVRSKLALDK
jgi:epsilon-lactone hydrolase